MDSGITLLESPNVGLQITEFEDTPESFREIGEADLAAVAALLAEGFPRRRPEFWHIGFKNMRALSPVPGYPRYGYLLEEDGRLQGAILLITTRPDGAEPRSCLSSWYVRKPYRTKAPILYKLATMHEGGVHVNLSPAAHVVPIARAFGFRPYTKGICLIDPRASARLACDGRLTPFEPTSAGNIGAAAAELARRHQGYGCKVLLLESRMTPPELIIYRVKLVKALIPCAQILHGTPDRVLGAAGPLMRRLLADGILLAQVDIGDTTNTGGLPCYPGRNMRYAKGRTPEVGDMLDSEFAVFGP